MTSLLHFDEDTEFYPEVAPLDMPWTMVYNQGHILDEEGKLQPRQHHVDDYMRIKSEMMDAGLGPIDHGGRKFPSLVANWARNPTYLNMLPYKKPVVAAPESYDPYGEPRMVPFVQPSTIDDYVLRYDMVPWGPYSVSIPSFGRFTNFVGRQQVPHPHGPDRNPRADKPPLPLDEPSRFKPQKRYSCDGIFVRDELGERMAQLKKTDNGTEICDPKGLPLMRYDAARRSIINIRTDRRGPDDVVAILNPDRREILNGNRQLWADEENPAVLYEYNARLKADRNLYVYIYDAIDHRHLATVRRPQKTKYPAEMAVMKDVEQHILLVSIFLV